MEGLRLRAIHRLRRSRPSGAAHVPSSGTYSHNSAHTPAAVGICEFDVLRANEAPRVPSLAIPRIAFPMACRGSAGVAVLMRAIRGESATRTYCFRQVFPMFLLCPSLLLSSCTRHPARSAWHPEVRASCWSARSPPPPPSCVHSACLPTHTRPQICLRATHACAHRFCFPTYMESEKSESVAAGDSYSPRPHPVRAALAFLLLPPISPSPHHSTTYLP